MKKITLIFILIISPIFNVLSQTNINHTYVFNDGPDKNPMKGWNSGWWNDHEFSSVGFQYLKWKEFEPTDDNFNTDAIEEMINRDGTQGRHLIIRLYADWFGQNPESDAGPEWLFINKGVERLEDNYIDGEGDTQTKYATDYNNPNYINEAIEAIEALSDYLDNDPRVYSIQLGVLGYWGEWHNVNFGNENDNSNDDDDGFEIADQSRIDILNAYKTNFSNKRLMSRYPKAEPLASDNTIGFHNDFFFPNDGHSDDFDDAVFEGNKWSDGPIGGEIPPVFNFNDPEEVKEQKIQEFMSELFGTSDGIDKINTAHYSTMQIGTETLPCERDPNGDWCDSFLAMHRKMGYNYQIESAVFPDQIALSENLTIDLNILNIGVAPMYYNWDVQFALLNQNNDVIETYNSSYDLTTITSSGGISKISISNVLDGISEDTYQLAVRIIQPDADKTKAESWKLNARNTYVLFANDMPIIDGTWDNDNALIGGWSILGDINVQSTSLSINDNTLKENIQIYPNPSNNVLNVSYNNFSLKSIKIYDATGHFLSTVSGDTEVTNNIKTIDIRNLSSGIYYLTIETTEGIKSQNRFIKN